MGESRNGTPAENSAVPPYLSRRLRWMRTGVSVGSQADAQGEGSLSAHELMSFAVRDSAHLLNRIDELQEALGRILESADRRDRMLLAKIDELKDQVELRTLQIGELQRRVESQANLAGGTLSSLFAERAILLKAETAAAEAEWQAWRATAPKVPLRPLRRNRPSKYFDKVMARIPVVGSRLVLVKSGLWRREYRRTSARHSLARPLSLAAVLAFPLRDTMAVFDPGFYGASVRPEGEARLPLAHYIAFGARDSAVPHPLFSNAFYFNQNVAGISATGLTPLQHFLFVGAYEGSNPHPLFDVRYYVGQAGARSIGGMNPLVHYLLHGWKLGLSPHPLFDAAWYLKRYPDVQKVQIPPLVHYVTSGAREWRDPHPLFDAAWYIKQYGLEAVSVSPLEDFIQRGRSHRRCPNEHFDTAFYVSQCRDAREAANPLIDYIKRGAWLGLTPFRNFPVHDIELWQVSDLLHGKTPLESWLLNSERRPAV
jgi:hypothetical protein